MLSLLALPAYAQFPYSIPFTSGSIDSRTILGNTSTLIDGVGRLTNNLAFQAGYVYVDIPFSSTYGIKTSFEYFAYGGTGADGMSFFLFDGTVTNSDFQIGAFGGSLGYAPRVVGADSDPGLKGAYMGIGLDSYGNFGLANESKLGGYGDGVTRVRDGISIRGPESDNYRYVAGVQTNTAPYNFKIESETPARVTNPSTAGYRKVYIDLQPLAIGYQVVVKMDIGGVAGTQTILTANYPYPAPPTLKLGFAGSTGGSTNFHEIDNVLIEVSDVASLINPISVDDDIAICNESNVTMSVLNNDDLQNDEPTYFDVSKLDLDPNTAGIQTSISLSNKGTFVANADGTVTFTPVAAFIGDAEIYYTITDNYNKTSNQSRIKVTSKKPDLQVNPTLTACGSADLRTAISIDYSAFTLQYYKLDSSNNKVLTSLAAISNLSSTDSGTYYILAGNGTGCTVEKQVVVTVNVKPPTPAITLLP